MGKAKKSATVRAFERQLQEVKGELASLGLRMPELEKEIRFLERVVQIAGIYYADDETPPA